MNVKNALHVTCLANTFGRLNDIFTNALANIVVPSKIIPLELIHTNRDSVRKVREAHLIDKAKTLEPQGLNRRDELH